MPSFLVGFNSLHSENDVFLKRGRQAGWESACRRLPELEIEGAVEDSRDGSSHGAALASSVKASTGSGAKITDAPSSTEQAPTEISR